MYVLIYKKTLVVVAVDVEKDAVEKAIYTNGKFDVKVVGVGPVFAGVNTAFALATSNYDLIINIGIAGGFSDRVNIGSVVVASELVAADSGAEQDDIFLTMEDMNLGISRIQTPPILINGIYQQLKEHGFDVYTGPISTVSTVTGSSSTELKMRDRVKGIVAEAMEGFAVGLAASIKNIDMIEIRVISNQVGPRDTNKWKIKQSLDKITEVMKVIEVYL